MKKGKIDRQSLLSSLWIFVLFNILFRDLHQFLNPEALQAMLVADFPEVQVLLFGFILEIPIMMTLLARLLNDRANKWENVGAAAFTLLGIVSTLPTADMDDLFFMFFKMAALIWIIRIAWSLVPKERTNNGPQIAQVAIRG